MITEARDMLFLIVPTSSFSETHPTSGSAERKLLIDGGWVKRFSWGRHMTVQVVINVAFKSISGLHAKISGKVSGRLVNEYLFSS